jgi:nucleoside-diphosphate-sugar epimerase
VWGDIRNDVSVMDAISGVDVVCNLAYINGTAFFYSKPQLVLDVTIRDMLNVIDGCRAHGVRELIYASSSEVYQTPLIVSTDEKVSLSVLDPLNPSYSYFKEIWKWRPLERR